MSSSGELSRWLRRVSPSSHSLTSARSFSILAPVQDAGQGPLTSFDYAIRTAIYRAFAEHGIAPEIEDLARDERATRDEVAGSLHRLQAAHLLVLAPGSDRIWMAHPFSSIPTEYPVETPSGSYWANCAWDAFAIPHLLDTSGRCETRCPESRVSLTIEVGPKSSAVIPDGAVVHFAVPARRFWDNVAYT